MILEGERAEKCTAVLNEKCRAVLNEKTPLYPQLGMEFNDIKKV